MTVLIREKPLNDRHADYKWWLRTTCEFQCVYCGLTERERGGACNMAREHYRPRSAFPDLVDVYYNLVYSCSRCNEYKGDFWQTSEQMDLGQYILNPFEHDIDEHIDRSKPVWSAKTTTGDWNIVKLRLSDAGKVSLREERRTTEELWRELHKDVEDISSFIGRGVQGGWLKHRLFRPQDRLRRLQGEEQLFLQRLSPRLDDD